MVAYSFRKQFDEPILSWAKRQTIRGHRKRHARPGEAVQLYVGMRTKYCRKLISPDPVCTSVETIRMDIPASGVGSFRIGEGGESLLTDEFAIADGFADAGEMTDFWRKEHGVGPFEGVLIRWEQAA